MKYEEIKVGKKYQCSGYIEEVLFKHDDTKNVVSIDQNKNVGVCKHYYNDWEPLNELPETGLVVAIDDSLILMRDGESSGYGFDYLRKWRKYNDWSFVETPELWRPATKKDVKRWKELSEKELVNRYGKDWKDVKLKDHACGAKGTINNGIFTPNITSRSIFNNNGKLFYYGKWAEILEEDITTEEATEAFEKFAKWFGKNVKEL